MKLPSFSKLRHLPITLRMLRFGVRRLRCSCSVLFAASCLLFSGASSAELTQQEVEDALYNALISAPISFNQGAINTVPWLYPSFSGLTIGEWLITKTGYTPDISDSSTLRSDLLLILSAINDQKAGDTNLVEFLRSYLDTIEANTTSIDGTMMDIAGYVPLIWGDTSDISNKSGDILSTLLQYGSLWDQIRDDDKWNVHDSELQSALAGPLSNIDSTVDGISDALGGISDSASGIQDSISSIDERLSSINQNWLTKDQLQDVIDSAEEPSHDEPPDDSGEKEQAERSAEYEWTQAESTSYSNRWELAEWKYTEMLPGNASIVSENPSDNPGGTGFSPDDSGFPLFSRLVEAQEFGMSINSSTIEPGDYPVFMSYYNEFRVRWARIFHAVWDFVGAFMVFFIARREWKYYMGVGDNSPEVDSDSGGIF